MSELVADAFRKARRQTSYLRHLVVIGETVPGELSFEEITRDAEIATPSSSLRRSWCQQLPKITDNLGHVPFTPP